MMYRHSMEYGIIWKLLDKEGRSAVLVHPGRNFKKKDIGRIIHNIALGYWENNGWDRFSEYLKLL